MRAILNFKRKMKLSQSFLKRKEKKKRKVFKMSMHHIREAWNQIKYGNALFWSITGTYKMQKKLKTFNPLTGQLFVSPNKRNHLTGTYKNPINLYTTTSRWSSKLFKIIGNRFTFSTLIGLFRKSNSSMALSIYYRSYTCWSF